MWLLVNKWSCFPCSLNSSKGTEFCSEYCSEHTGLLKLIFRWPWAESQCLERFKTSLIISLLQWQTGTYCIYIHVHSQRQDTYHTIPLLDSAICIYAHRDWHKSLFSDAQLRIHQYSDMKHDRSAAAIIIYRCKVICMLNFPPYLSRGKWECGRQHYYL